jgi:hypothetical protein
MTPDSAASPLSTTMTRVTRVVVAITIALTFIFCQAAAVVLNVWRRPFAI